MKNNSSRNAWKMNKDQIMSKIADGFAEIEEKVNYNKTIGDYKNGI